MTKTSRNAKLNETEVRRIRRRVSQGGENLDALAGEFGVTANNIRLIVNRQTWKHVTDEEPTVPYERPARSGHTSLNRPGATVVTAPPAGAIRYGARSAGELVFDALIMAHRTNGWVRLESTYTNPGSGVQLARKAIETHGTTEQATALETRYVEEVSGKFRVFVRLDPERLPVGEPDFSDIPYVTEDGA